MVVGVALEDFGSDPPASSSAVATPSATLGFMHALVRVQWYTGDGFALPITNDFSSVLGSSTSSGTLSVDKPAIFYQGMTILGKTSVEALEAIRTMTVGLLSFDGIGTSINAVGSVLNVQNSFGAGAVSFFNRARDYPMGDSYRHHLQRLMLLKYAAEAHWRCDRR
jgi:hypothetical protein